MRIAVEAGVAEADRIMVEVEVAADGGEVKAEVRVEEAAVGIGDGV